MCSEACIFGLIILIGLLQNIAFTSNFASLVVKSIITECKTPGDGIVILGSIVGFGLKKMGRRARKITNETTSQLCRPLPFETLHECSFRTGRQEGAVIQARSQQEPRATWRTLAQAPGAAHPRSNGRRWQPRFVSEPSLETQNRLPGETAGYGFSRGENHEPLRASSCNSPRPRGGREERRGGGGGGGGGPGVGHRQPSWHC